MDESVELTRNAQRSFVMLSLGIFGIGWLGAVYGSYWAFPVILVQIVALSNLQIGRAWQVITLLCGICFLAGFVYTVAVIRRYSMPDGQVDIGLPVPAWMAVITVGWMWASPLLAVCLKGRRGWEFPSKTQLGPPDRGG